MKTFAEWLKANRGEDLPQGSISGAWFVERNIPMIVACTNCESTMCVVSALINEDNETFCTTCVDE